jgi:hypothetical protein
VIVFAAIPAVPPVRDFATFEDGSLPSMPTGGVSLLSSLWTGDECTGELDSLLCESPLPPLPPRDEVRGETRPVFFGKEVVR